MTSQCHKSFIGTSTLIGKSRRYVFFDEAPKVYQMTPDAKSCNETYREAKTKEKDLRKEGNFYEADLLAAQAERAFRAFSKFHVQKFREAAKKERDELRQAIDFYSGKKNAEPSTSSEPKPEVTPGPKLPPQRVEKPAPPQEPAALVTPPAPEAPPVKPNPPTSVPEPPVSVPEPPRPLVSEQPPLVSSSVTPELPPVLPDVPSPAERPEEKAQENKEYAHRLLTAANQVLEEGKSGKYHYDARVGDGSLGCAYVFSDIASRTGISGFETPKFSTTEIEKLLKEQKWTVTTTPKVGDVALWEDRRSLGNLDPHGHAGWVVNVDAAGKVSTVDNMTGNGKPHPDRRNAERVDGMGEPWKPVYYTPPEGMRLKSDGESLAYLGEHSVLKVEQPRHGRTLKDRLNDKTHLPYGWAVPKSSLPLKVIAYAKVLLEKYKQGELKMGGHSEPFTIDGKTFYIGRVEIHGPSDTIPYDHPGTSVFYYNPDEAEVPVETPPPDRPTGS